MTEPNLLSFREKSLLPRHMHFFSHYCIALKEEFMVLSLSPGNQLITQINVLKAVVELHIFIPPYNPSCSFNCICSWTCNKTQVKNGFI